MLPIRTRLFALAGLCLASVCLAQTPESVRRDARVHAGPFYVTPRFSVKEFGVDTNVFNNAQAARDFTFTFVPSARISVPFGRRAVVTTNVATDLVYYQRYATERSFDPEVGFTVTGFLGHVQPYAESTWLRSRQRPNDEIDARLRRQEMRVRAGARLRYSPKLSFDVSAEQRQLEYDADAQVNDIRLQETLNRTTTRRTFDARYDLTPLTALVTRVAADRDRFPYSPLRDADSLVVLPGVEFEPRALIAGSARVGVKRFRPLNDDLAPFTGIIADASLSYTLQGATRFTVTARRDLTYSYERVQPYFVVAGYSIGVRRHLTGPLDVNAAFERQRYTYRDLLLPGATAADADRVDRTHSWSGSLGYRLGHAVRAGFGAAWRSRASTSARFRDYQGLRFLSTLDYEF